MPVGTLLSTSLLRVSYTHYRYPGRSHLRRKITVAQQNSRECFSKLGDIYKKHRCVFLHKANVSVLDLWSCYMVTVVQQTADFSCECCFH